jgi:collagen beta-1,O-galactosyltransferase
MDIKIEIRDPRKGFWSDADTELSWSPNRYDHILKLRQQALNHAINMLVDYLFMIDADNILVQVHIYQMISNFYTFSAEFIAETRSTR